MPPPLARSREVGHVPHRLSDRVADVVLGKLPAARLSDPFARYREGFAANIGGRMLGTGFAFLSAQLSNVMPGATRARVWPMPRRIVGLARVSGGTSPPAGGCRSRRERRCLSRAVHPSLFTVLGSCSSSVRSSKFAVRSSRFGVRGSPFGVRSSVRNGTSAKLRNPEPRTRTEPEHELRSENREA